MSESAHSTLEKNLSSLSSPPSSSSANKPHPAGGGLIGGSLFFMNQIFLAYKLAFQTLHNTISDMRRQFAANFSIQEEHFVYKQIDIMLRHATDNPNLQSIVKSLEQVTFYSNQAEVLFKFFAKDLKLPIIYGFQPFSQKENYPMDQSTRMGCVSLNNFKIQCVEQPGLNKIRGYLSHVFTLLFGERVVGSKEEAAETENFFSLDGIAKMLTSFGAVHTFALLGLSLNPSIAGDSDKTILKSRKIVCTSQFKHYHEFYMTKSMLSKLKFLDEKKIIGFKQTFLFGTMWEFYRKYMYRNEPFKNHGIYTIDYHPFFEIIIKLVTEKHVKYIRNNRNQWQLKNLPLGTLKIKSCKEVEFTTTAIREDVEGLKTFIKLFGSQNVEVIEPYRHYVWDFSKIVQSPNSIVPPKLRVICRDRTEVCETNRVYGLNRMILEVESLDQVQYQLSSNKIDFKLETDTIIIKHPLLQNMQINLVE